MLGGDIIRRSKYILEQGALAEYYPYQTGECPEIS
jgi:hypothetical protein